MIKKKNKLKELYEMVQNQQESIALLESSVADALQMIGILQSQLVIEPKMVNVRRRKKLLIEGAIL